MASLTWSDLVSLSFRANSSQLTSLTSSPLTFSSSDGKVADEEGSVKGTVSKDSAMEPESWCDGMVTGSFAKLGVVNRSRGS